MKNKRLLFIVFIVPVLLLIPLVAMQFSAEVVWTTSDFVIAAVLLLSTGLAIEFILRRVKTIKNRIILSGIILAILFLIWAELAVGVFGTPFAGS
ncbi:hypothetical protein [Salegentibacter sediminis]|uniref:hypothetical protein n=1 Tax=Salegentibacter sediminis TaxID=1930251 RepID=UPI0009BE29FC|nr:hypothetical protein [Salegentibacter sediminis]